MEDYMKRVYLAGGCFWGAETYIAMIPGVVKTEVGYANGKTVNPSYEDVKRRNTGHAETVLVDYDPAILSLDRLLELFYLAIDPASLNRQGPDEGTQYRTGIYYTDEEDRAVIEKSLEALQAVTDSPVVVEAKPLENYYTAEEYHQKYLDKNPGGYCHIGSGTFEKLRRKLASFAR
jgi:methionine-S-sulfoxide reductase